MITLHKAAARSILSHEHLKKIKHEVEKEFEATVVDYKPIQKPAQKPSQRRRHQYYN